MLAIHPSYVFECLAMVISAGVLAYLGFGGYLGLGETLWSQPLNFYLLPVIVSVYVQTHH